MKMKNNYETFRNNLKPGFMFRINNVLCLVLTVGPTGFYSVYFFKDDKHYIESYPISGMDHNVNFEIIVSKAKK